MNITQVTRLALVALAVTGCTSAVTVDIAPAIDRTLCRQDATAEIWWTTRWRPDQKDVAQREVAAEQGIQQFLSKPGCYASTVLHRGSPANMGAPPGAVRIALIVRELGPTLRIGSSLALVDGATEVVFDIETTHEPRIPQRITVRWRDGGPGTVKGGASLPADMAAALATAFRAPPLR